MLWDSTFSHGSDVYSIMSWFFSLHCPLEFLSVPPKESELASKKGKLLTSEWFELLTDLKQDVKFELSVRHFEW